MSHIYKMAFRPFYKYIWAGRERSPDYKLRRIGAVYRAGGRPEANEESGRRRVQHFPFYDLLFGGDI